MEEPSLLFRPEVVRAKLSRSHGEIRLDQPASGVVIAIIAVLLCAALIAFICLGTVARKARVAGITVPTTGSVGVTAPVNGVLTRVLVSEGEQVRQGQALFELSTAREGENGDIATLVSQQQELRRQALASERRLRIRQDAEARRALEEKLRNNRSESQQLDIEIDLAQRRQDLSAAGVKQFQTLHGGGFVSIAQLQQKQQDQIDAAARVGALQRSKVQLDASRLNLAAELDGMATRLETDLAQLDNSQAALDQQVVENLGKKTVLVTAPVAGIVAAIGFQTGYSISQAQSLATLIPKDREDEAAPALEVLLFVPSRTAGFIAAGQDVLIRYQAFPYQMYGLYPGRVTEVSSTPFAAAELPANLVAVVAGAAGQGGGAHASYYRVRVSLARQTIDIEGRRQSLRPGMPLEADVIQDRRRIWQWMIAPALAAKLNP